ncbi:hypothetical protein PI124_g6763 [Phytophthora idaei]|nr:hypothetical protein PI125_g13349 [Phytophthora idaei]KAG3248599.1 hypothetical protein PI124_g6763 [Phytophthora idaei]
MSANPRLTFDMPTTYTQVLEEIVKLRREAKRSATLKERLATIMLDIIRGVINHEYEGKLGTKYEVLRQSGALWHDLLMLSPFWNALLAIDTDMVERFKRLLRRFDLAYPASRQQKFDTDLIVPTYWKLREISRHRSLSRHESVLDRHYGVGNQVAKWKYSVSVAVSEAIFVNFVVSTSQYDDIKRLVVESDKRLFPAVRTISCSKEKSTIELRIHSDLSGRCYHTPLEISTPNGFARFVADHATFIQVGISILSIASVAIPINVASTAVELTLSASGMADCATTRVRGIADRVSIVKTILDRANLDPGKNMSSQDMATSSEAQMGFLKKLLTLHDSSFDEFAVSETANLVRATTRNGSYVWVHESELKKLEGHRTPCANISLRISKVEGLSTSGLSNLQKEIYCAWEINPSWNSSAVKLDTVDTIEMLRECTLKVWVKQARHFTTWMRNDKVIGQGEKILNACIPVDHCSSTEVTIPFLPTGTASSLSVVCQVDSHVFRNPTTRIFDE